MTPLDESHPEYKGTNEESYALWLLENANLVGECWECHLAPNQKGYSNVAVGGRSGTKWRAHRLVWTVMNGPIPMFGNILHSCDNRRCIRPSHLWCGSEADNTADMMAKGRNKYILPDNRKLKDHMHEVLELRANGLSLAKIAARFGVSATTVLVNLRQYNE